MHNNQNILAEEAVTGSAYSDCTARAFTNYYCREWVEHNLMRVDRTLDSKVDLDDLVEVKELLHKKLDISTFLQTRYLFDSKTPKIHKQRNNSGELTFNLVCATNYS